MSEITETLKELKKTDDLVKRVKFSPFASEAAKHAYYGTKPKGK